jgi:hypothetical protein
VTYCDFNNPAKTCPTCGYVARRLPTFRQCRPVPEPVWRPIPLGDVVERLLTRLGVTKERVERWTRTAGKPGGCGCKARQKWLNEWGNKWQRRGRAKLQKFRRFCVGS